MIRKMTIDDIASLNFEADWMKDRYKLYLERETGPAWIMEDDKGPLCAFGAAFLWDGVCEVWFNLIRRERTVRQILAARRYLKEQGVIYRVKRFQATIKCDFKKGVEFVKLLGFHYEGKLEKYHPDGTDALMYARIEC